MARFQKGWYLWFVGAEDVKTSWNAGTDNGRKFLLVAKR